jgi:tetratricopeptide (TPR) repeat protein
MNSRRIPLVVIAGLLAAMFAANLVGGQLNTLFLALPGIDKVLHFGFHALLAICVRRFAIATGASVRMSAGVAIAVGVIASVADETVQGFTSTRTVEFDDLMADWAGLTLGLVVTTRPLRVTTAVAGLAACVVGVYVAYDTHLKLRDYSRGLEYERRGDFSHARTMYLQALAAGLQSPGLYNGLAWVEIESGHSDFEQAVVWGATALAMRPENADFLDTYGWALHHAGRSAEAISYLERAYQTKPQMFCIHYHLGLAYLATGRSDLAVSHLRQQLLLPNTRESAKAKETLARIGAS